MNQERISEALDLPMPEGGIIRGRISFARTGHPALVYAHGFGSTSVGEKGAALEAECELRGWGYAACDFRGHGISGGAMSDLTPERLLEDLDVTVGAVAQRVHGAICLVGSSMGGWTSAWFASRAPGRIRACALIAPAFHFLEWKMLDPAAREVWKRTGRLRIRNEFMDTEIGYALCDEAVRYPVDALAARLHNPLILFHGMQDAVVPYSDSSEFAAQCAAEDIELRIIKKGDHRLNQYKEKIARAACDFFADFV